MRAVLLSLSLFLASCGVFGPVEPISKPSSPAETAQLAVNEANLSLAAAANVVSSNVKDRIWTKEQAQGYLNKIRDYAKDVDRAQDLVRAGQFELGKSQAELTKSLIIILHREIAAKARQP